MTVNEFKAFLEGVNVAEGKAPTAKEWKRIKDKIETLSESGSLFPSSPIMPDPIYPDLLRGFPPGIAYPAIC